MHNFAQVVTREFRPNDKVLVFYDLNYDHIIQDLEILIRNHNYENIIFTRVIKEVKRTRENSYDSNASTNLPNAASTTKPTKATDYTNSTDPTALTNTTNPTNHVPINLTSLNEMEHNSRICCGDVSARNTGINECCGKQQSYYRNNFNDVKEIDSSTSILNGRQFELVSGSSLGDYHFLCITLSSFLSLSGFVVEAKLTC